MKYTKKTELTRDKYGILKLKAGGEPLYFPIEKHGAMRCLCSYYKTHHKFVTVVNKVIDENGKEWVAVSKAETKSKKNGKKK